MPRGGAEIYFYVAWAVSAPWFPHCLPFPHLAISPALPESRTIQRKNLKPAHRDNSGIRDITSWLWGRVGSREAACVVCIFVCGVYLCVCVCTHSYIWPELGAGAGQMGKIRSWPLKGGLIGCQERDTQSTTTLRGHRQFWGVPRRDLTGLERGIEGFLKRKAPSC